MFTTQEGSVIVWHYQWFVWVPLSSLVLIAAGRSFYAGFVLQEPDFPKWLKRYMGTRFVFPD